MISSLVTELDSCTARFGAFHPETIAVAHKLATAFWSEGDTNRAVTLLDQALSHSIEREHPVRVDVLCTLAEIMVEQEHWEQASVLYREVLDCCTRRSGANHASSLAAKGDLAVALFELGDEAEAARMEREAMHDATVHLGEKHPVTSVLSWNRVMRGESGLNDLLWLLLEDEKSLESEQRAIRALLHERLGQTSELPQ